MYSMANNGINATRKIWMLRSTDYGATWDSTLIKEHIIRRYGGIWVGDIGGSYDPGTVLYATINVGGGGDGRVYYSIDGGDSWVFKQSIASSIWLGRVLIDPDDQSKSYTGLGMNGPDLGRSTTVNGVYTEIDGALSAGISISNTHGHGWVKGDLIRTVRNGAIYLTDDGGAVWESRAAPFTSQNVWAPGDGNDDYVAVASRDSASALHPHTVKSSIDRGVTWHDKSGAHADIAGTGGGDSVPYDSGGVAQDGFQVHMA